VILVDTHCQQTAAYNGRCWKRKRCWLQPAVVINLKCLFKRNGLLNFEFFGYFIFHIGVYFVVADAGPLEHWLDRAKPGYQYTQRLFDAIFE
jgi:hypothetical protein